MHRLVKTDLDAAWNVALLLLDEAQTDDEVGYIAAGPLEDLIDMYGHKALDRIEEECENNSRLQLALSTAGVLYYYDEFERWYGLLYRYGYKQERVANVSVIADVMKTMKAYLNDGINVYEYGYRITEMLDKPFDDKAAQRILQQRRWDVEILDSKRTPITKPEVKQRVTEAMIELESLGYKAGE